MFNKQLVAAMLLANVSAEAVHVATPIQAKSVIIGFLNGAIGAKEYPATCINNYQVEFDHIAAAIPLLKSDDNMDILDGLVKLADTFSLLSADVKACSGDFMYADSKKLETMAVIFNDPKIFVFQKNEALEVNGASIKGEMDIALNYYNTQAYDKFGIILGDIALKVLFPGTDSLEASETLGLELNVQKYKDLAEGMIKGALDAEAMVNIESCVSDFMVTGKHVENALHDFQQKDIPDAIAGLKEIGLALKSLGDTLGPCTQTQSEMAQLKEMIAVFSNAKELLERVHQDLVAHGPEVIQETK